MSNPALDKIHARLAISRHSISVMIDCRSVYKIRGGGETDVLCELERRVSNTRMFGPFLERHHELLCRDPSGPNEPEVIRCVDILWLVSQFVVYSFLELCISSFACALLWCYGTFMA
jgi:hypothetical protein